MSGAMPGAVRRVYLRLDQSFRAMYPEPGERIRRAEMMLERLDEPDGVDWCAVGVTVEEMRRIYKDLVQSWRT